MKRIVPLFHVANLTTSLAFYRDLLGFNVTYTMAGDDGELVHAGLQHGDVNMMLSVESGEGDSSRLPVSRRSGIVTYLTVDDGQDLDAFYNRVKAAGARVVSEPTDQFYGEREWAVIDPDGHQLIFGKPIPGFQVESLAENEAFVFATD